MGAIDNKFPSDKLPSCWSDDVRMNALFAPFRLKSANPESWNMKMKFWSDMLRQWCRHKGDPVICVNDVKSAFQRNGRIPTCLDIVVEECLRNGDLVPVSKYLDVLHNYDEGWIRWGARLAVLPAAFAVGFLTSYIPFTYALDSDGLPKASIDPTQHFVMESAVKDQANELLSKFPAGADRLGTVDELMYITGYTPSQRETFEILLGYLIRQELAAKKGNIIKLVQGKSKVMPITASDEALHRLLSAENKVIADYENFSKQSEQALIEARKALKLGNKVAAKNFLRQKHKFADRATSCDSTLDNVRQLIHNLRQMEMNATVADTYKTSAEAMKRGMLEEGIDEDSVHNTIDELKEVLDTYKEVEKTLAGNIDDEDAAELEAELEDLLASGPSPPAGGTPQKEERTPIAEGGKEPKRSLGKPKKVLERDFVFDCEERVIAELNDLGVEDGSLPSNSEKKAVAVEEQSSNLESKDNKPSKQWYPPTTEFLSDKNANDWNQSKTQNFDRTLGSLCSNFNEIRMDDRIHPGQKPDIEYPGPVIYSTDFQVQDHREEDKVWFFNTKDGNQNWKADMENDFGGSTEYYSSESPGKSSGNFQMAPGGERKAKHQPWPSDNTVEELERRLKNLRGFNL